MAYLPPPVSVSPLIKICRWAAILVGIFWGRIRQNVLTEKEELIRELQSKQMRIRNDKTKMVKADALREEMLYMGQVAGVATPPYFDEAYPMTQKADMERLCREEEEFYKRYEAFHGVLYPSREVCEKYGIVLGPKSHDGSDSWCTIM